MMPGGQTLNDRLNAARYALAGQGLARTVCKATTEEMIAPKKKHIDYLLQCTDEPNVSIPQLANLLIERTQQSNWIVVFKALITVHHLMCYGNERFTQYLASSNCNFQLNTYVDKAPPKGYDMSIFIRRYARYINYKALSYRTVAFDFTKVKRGEEGQLRQMGMEKLIKTLPILQTQIDTLLEFDCNASDLTNNVINAAFFLLFKDLIRLFACYNDGIITCLEKYFEITNKKLARETLDIYKKFLTRMNKVGEFLKVAEMAGIDRGEIPDLTKAPSSLLEAMEHHLDAMEGRKPGSSANEKQPVDEQTSVKKAIEEEEKFLNKLKEKHLQDKKVNNPFLSSSNQDENNNKTTAKASSSDDKKSNNKNNMIDLLMDNNQEKSSNVDLFSLDTSPSSSSTAAMAANNPFADILSSLGSATPTAAAAAATTATSNTSPAANNNNSSGDFATSDGFAAAFGSSSNSNIGKNKSTKQIDSDRNKAPSRPPPPSSATAKVDDENRSAKPPSRPPAPAASKSQSKATPAATTPTTQSAGEETGKDQNQLQQQFLQLQQQMMQQFMQNSGNTGADPSQMMAQMQMMMSQMMMKQNPSTTDTDISKNNEKSGENVKNEKIDNTNSSDTSEKQAEQIENTEEIAENANNDDN